MAEPKEGAPDEDGSWSGPSLDADGNLTGLPGQERSPAPAPASPPPQAPAPELSSLSEDPGAYVPQPSRNEEPLELAGPARRYSREPPAEEYVREPTSRPRRGRALAVVGIALLAGVGVLAAINFIPQTAKLARVLELPSGPRPTLFLDSEPSGATVKINGQSLGQTPLVQDNLYPPGAKIEVQMVLDGYRTAKGSFQGGEPAKLVLNLRRR